MIADPFFYLAAIPAILLFGISKGGFGGGLGVLAVPLMALAIPPAQAAAVMLPILMVMDVGAVWAWRAQWDRGLMNVLLPAGLLGTALGTLSFTLFTAAGLKLLLGAIAIGFVLQRWLARAQGALPAPRSAAKGWLWGAVAGLTSFVAHAGGPPISVYLLPLRLAPAMLMGTVSLLFAALNWSKVLPYWWLGLFSAQNLLTSAALAPMGLAGIWLGVWLHKRLDAALFYRLMYAFLLLTGLKLLHDGFGF